MNPFSIRNTSFKAILLLILVNASAYAQQADSLRMTLDEAIAIALKNSYEIQIAKNNVVANTIFNNYGIAGGLPVIAGNFTNTEQITSVKQKLNTGVEINRRSATGNNTQANVTASILLYNGMRVVSTKKRLAELQYQSSELLNSQVQNTIAQVMTSYYDVV